MRSLALLLVLFAALTGCSGATIDEAYGRPGALAWSYFEAAPERVADAARRALTSRGFRVEQVLLGASDGSVRMTVAPVRRPAAFEEIRIEPVREGAWRARAQTVPDGRRLGRTLERAIERGL